MAIVLYDEIKKMDNKVKVCFLSATYSDYEAARKIFPMLEIECYIQKPVGIEDGDEDAEDPLFG